ncbi:MAG TPA: hypothetical protein VMV88_11165 [Gallionella sp.]|nr:hypothetical protein [Gallionella sp.]
MDETLVKINMTKPNEEQLQHMTAWKFRWVPGNVVAGIGRRGLGVEVAIQFTPECE